MTFGFPIWLFFCETFWIFGSTYHRVYARSETLEDMGTYDVTAILLIASKSSLKCSQGYLQNAFKILLSAWKKCFAHTSFDLLMSCSMVSQHVSTWNSGKAFTFSSPKLQAMKVSWLTNRLSCSSVDQFRCSDLQFSYCKQERSMTNASVSLEQTRTTGSILTWTKKIDLAIVLRNEGIIHLVHT